jgi:UrcA family protein
MNPSIAKRCAHIAIATVATGLAVNHAWAAGSGDEPQSVVVRYADLDLSRPTDARTLYDRIHAAARQVCQDGGGMQDLARLRAYRRCVDQAMANAVANVSSARVTEIHEAVVQRHPRS